MYSDWVWLLLGVAVFLWLMILSFLVWQQRDFLKSLFPKSGERDIRKKFEEIVTSISDFDQKLSNLDQSLKSLEVEELKHIQRIQLLRYNPYEDTGGDQSFSVVLLDNKGNGIVVTSLHARSGTRVFAKPVVEGRASKYQFSKEEQLAVKRAVEGKSS